ncbi:MAG: hypothetical protein C4327_05665 [Meiothermus sp.]
MLAGVQADGPNFGGLDDPVRALQQQPHPQPRAVRLEGVATAPHDLRPFLEHQVGVVAPQVGGKIGLLPSAKNFPGLERKTSRPALRYRGAHRGLSLIK